MWTSSNEITLTRTEPFSDEDTAKLFKKIKKAYVDCGFGEEQYSEDRKTVTMTVYGEVDFLFSLKVLKKKLKHTKDDIQIKAIEMDTPVNVGGDARKKGTSVSSTYLEEHPIFEHENLDIYVMREGGRFNLGHIGWYSGRRPKVTIYSNFVSISWNHGLGLRSEINMHLRAEDIVHIERMGACPTTVIERLCFDYDYMQSEHYRLYE